MRIQHNIAAMNSYRNYNANASALSKNLEKLSSGYRINRAGDDAAGLAISEKMRAQISGLDQAQANVKDGISLVKTAEGALQEVQDMMNRMVTLATQSANGTYQDAVDRENLQKEVTALKTEIDRIADSSNFNGQKLLNGELDSNADFTTTGTFKLPAEGSTLGTDTILHKDAVGTGKATFSVDLHNVEFGDATGETLDIQIGNDTITLTGAGGGQTLTGADLTDAIVNANGTATINGATFDVTKDGSRLIFTQQANDTAVVNGDMAVTVSGTGSAAVAAEYSFTLTGGVQGGIGGKVIDGETITWNTDLDTTMGDFVTAYNAATHDYTASYAGGVLTLEAKTTGAVATAPTSDIVDLEGDGSNTAVTAAVVTAGADAGTSSVKGDYNKSTTVITSGVADAKERLASTSFSLTKDMIAEGASITIGTETYTFGDNGVKISDLDADSNDYLSDVAERLTKAAASNTVYTVGHDGSKITVTENEGQSAMELDTMEGIEKSLGYSGAKAAGSSLTLQIGDTADEYNQLKVSINDMHTKALGIADIDISDIEGAQKAIETIKTAINKVSSTRGDLGAIQNRLEHTSNNLSVMEENIQDAESTIRDTDIADEMTTYTKNNILLQSAQAMLAQANQMPQGVLQLLQ